MIRSKLMSYYYIGNRTVLPTPPAGNQSNLMVWLDASRIVSTDNTVLTSVTGLSGNGNDFTSATGPTYRATKVAGMPVMEFAVNQSLTGSRGVYNPQQTIFIAYSQRTGSNGTLFSSTTGAKQLQREFAVWPNENNPSIPISRSLNASNVLRLEYDYTADIYQVYQNKTLAGSGVSLIDQNLLGQVLLGDRGGSTEFLNANIHEILVYNQILTPAEDLIVEDYLIKKWGFLPINPEFTVNTIGWNPYVNGGTLTAPTVTAVAGECKIDTIGTFAQSGIESASPIQFEAGSTYRLYFDARSVNPTTVNLLVRTNQSPGYAITATKTTNFFEFTTVSGVSASVIVRTADTMLNNPTLFVDNIYLREVNKMPVLGGLVGWYNANNVIQSSHIVSQMTDISESGNHFLQATTGEQPLLVVNSINGRPTVNFDGFNDTLQMSNAVLGTNVHTIFFVYSVNSPGGVKAMLALGQTAGDGFNYRANGTSAFFVADSISGIPAGNLVSNTFEILSSNFDGINLRVNRNNIDVINQTQSININPGNIVIGNRMGAGEFSEVKVAELLVYNRVLTTAEQTTVYQFLKTKYNL